MHTSIAEYHTDLVNGKTTCYDTVQSYLSRIDKYKHLNAFTEIYADEALQKATSLDELRATKSPLKKLHGVVFAIKDVICYKDHKLTAASAILNNFKSVFTSSALQYLLDEDAIIIGSCNCDEFAMGSTNENSVYGPVKNMLDESRVPGGSSGGSAVAVQADMCMLSLGSDTGGSVRQPADFCGIFGLKPSYGRISRYGLIAYASSFDQVGIFGKNIPDIALALQVMSKPDKLDSTMCTGTLPDLKVEFPPEKKYRIAILTEVMEHPGLDVEIARSINVLSGQLQSSGHTVNEMPLPLLDYIVPAYYVLTTAEASSNLNRYDGVRYGLALNDENSLEDFYKDNRAKGFGMEVKRRIMLGSFVLSTGYYDAYFAKAQQIRQLLVNKIEEIFKTCDAIILPVSPSTAYKLGEQKDPVSTYLTDIYTVMANLAGIPAMALPLFSHSNNMPYGLQVMTKRMDEVTLFEICSMLTTHSQVHAET